MIRVARGDMAETMPKLQAEDVADSVIYVLSTPPNVQVHNYLLC